MFHKFASLYWHTIKDNSFVECFKNNKVNPDTKKPMSQLIQKIGKLF